MKLSLKKTLALFLCAAMLFGVLPPLKTYAAKEVKVFLSVSDKGNIALDRNGREMANREIAAKDEDGDGTVTYYEALLTAHKDLCRGGASALDVGTWGWVNKLWGKEELAGFSFMRNNVAEMSTVTGTALKEGDHLLASINQDDKYWTDWNTYFEVYDKEVEAGDSFTLTLKGYQAMSINTPAAAAGVRIGTSSGGKFTQKDSLVTDKEGKVTLSFENPGTYIVSAQGSVKDQVDLSWKGLGTVTKDCPIISPVCVVRVKEKQQEPVLLASGKAKSSKKLTIKWNRIQGAQRYVIYFTQCSGKSKFKKVKTINGNKTLSWTKKGLKKGKSYKFKVLAQKKEGGKYKTIATSLVSHAIAGGSNGKYTNPKSLKLSEKKKTIKVGSTYKIKASVKKLKSGKKLLTSHAKKLRYISDNENVATVSKSGEVKAKKAGKCRIYVQGINGIWASLELTVK